MVVSSTFEAVWQIVRQIPAGKVATYGQIAALMGNPRLSRVIGYAMHGAPKDVPCQRVVNRLGSLCPGFEPLGTATHRMLLEMEGVPFRPDGTVDLEHCRWEGYVP